MVQSLRNRIYDPEDEKSFGSPEQRSGQGVSGVPAEQLERIPTASQADIDQSRSQHTPTSQAGSSPLAPKTNTYDAPGTQDSSPLARPRESGAAESAGELQDRESNPDSGAKGAVGKAEKGLIGDGLNAADKFLPPQARLANMAKKVFTKKKSAAGAIAGVIAGVLVFLFSIGSGPLQLVHLSELLSKNFFGTEKSSSLRVKGLFRFYRTGDIGETRVTKLGSTVFKRTIGKLEKIGFDFSDRNKVTGHLKSVKIDPSKHPAFKNLPAGERRAAIIKHFEIKDPGILSGGGNSFKIDLDSTSVKGMNFANSLTGTAVGDLQNGKVVTGMGLRTMKKFYSLPRLFSPLEKRVKSAENTGGTKIERRKAEEERRTKARGPTEAKGLEAGKRIQGSMAGKVASGVLISTAALCLIREVGDDVVTANRYQIAIPAALEATDKVAVGAQVKSGNNFAAGTVGTVAESFVDEKTGKTIWGGKALQVLSGKAKPGGEDLGDEYKQGFSNDTTAQNLINTIGTPTFVGIDLGGVACSPVGLLAQGALSIGLLVAGPVSLGGSWAAFAGKAAAGAAATAAVMHYLKKLAVGALKSDAILPKVFSGPLGGNLLAYGGREAGNIGARASGGVALSNTESAVVDRHQEQESQQEFQSKSFASRMFDVYDHRSLAGNLIDTTSPSPGQNLTNIASSLTNIGSSLTSGLFSAFTPKAQAAGEAYNWAFPRYGIPQKLLDDTNLEDPYDNGDKVAVLLRETGDKYPNKVKNCFGITLSKESGVWDAVSEEEVNPNDEKYLDEKCDDISDGNWKRVILFVFDTRLITEMACYEGDPDDEETKASCTALGIDESPQPDGAESDTATTGDANLKKTSTVKSSGKFITMPDRYSCPGRTTRIDSRIAASLAYLLTTYNMCADDGLASGHKSHGAGLGVDIRPKNQSKQGSKEEWKNTVEKAARDMGWTGDSADEGKSSKGCAKYSGYGNCVGGAGEIPDWVRWIGYNGDVDHGDKWHIFGGSYAHIHIGWASPNGGDAVSPGIIGSPIPAVYTFPAPIPDDLKDLIK